MSIERPRLSASFGFLVIGSGCMAAMIAAMAAAPDEAYQSYLFAYLFWLGISLGSLAIRMIWHLSGGAWGEFVYEPLAAASRLLPLLAVLFIPLCFALPQLFLWAQHSSAHSELILKKQWYLNDPFFYTRAAIYFVLWSIGPFLLDHSSERWQRRFSAMGLIIFAVTTYTAGVDWILALNLSFSSTIFGMIVAVGEMLSAMALVIVTNYFLTRDGDPPPAALASKFHDLGGLLLMFLLAWTYLTVSQFVTVWIADLPREIVWYLPRLETSWFNWGIVIVATHFVVPFALLLSRRLKSSPAGLASVAALLLVAHLVYEFWQVAPNLRTAGFAFYWTDLPAVGAVGGPWLWLYLWQLRRRYGPQPDEAAEYA